MKELKRIIAFTICLVMAMSTFALAVTPAAITTSDAVKKNPTAQIVSPADNSVITTDSLLVSVKLNKTATIKVTIYEEKIQNKKVVTNYVSGKAVTAEAISFASVDTSKFEEKDFAKLFADTTYAAIITTGGITKSAILTKAAVLPYVDKLYVGPNYYTSKDNLGYYTSKLEGVQPGMYKVVVETIEKKAVFDKDGKPEKDKDGNDRFIEETVEKTVSYIVVKEKPVEKPIATKEKSGALTIISNLLKSIFK